MISIKVILFKLLLNFKNKYLVNKILTFFLIKLLFTLSNVYYTSLKV